MTETLDLSVIHVVPPDELAEAGVESNLESLADGRYVLVCRTGGEPSWLERLWAFLRRRPIEAVTIVADAPVKEGATVTATVGETDIAGVYEAETIH